MFKSFERNALGRDLCVGDVHGYFTRLAESLDAVGFDPQRDRLFSVGDLVDRGPESDKLFDWLDKPWFHPVRGNHEDMAIRWGRKDCAMDATNYAGNGGGWNVSNPFEQRAEISCALSVLPVAQEISTEHGTVGIVHADCPLVDWATFKAKLLDPELRRAERKALIEHAMWSRQRIDEEDHGLISGVRAVVVGHSPVKTPAVLGNTLFIDTMGWKRDGSKGFSLLDLATLDATFVPTGVLPTRATDTL